MAINDSVHHMSTKENIKRYKEAKAQRDAKIRELYSLPDSKDHARKLVALGLMFPSGTANYKLAQDYLALLKLLRKQHEPER